MHTIRSLIDTVQQPLAAFNKRGSVSGERYRLCLKLFHISQNIGNICVSGFSVHTWSTGDTGRRFAITDSDFGLLILKIGTYALTPTSKKVYFPVTVELAPPPPPVSKLEGCLAEPPPPHVPWSMFEAVALEQFFSCVCACGWRWVWGRAAESESES